MCPEKKILEHAYKEAVRELTDLHTQEVDALVHGGNASRLDLAIERSRKKRETAKKRYSDHMIAHGC
jgi:hypothetical protein